MAPLYTYYLKSNVLTNYTYLVTIYIVIVYVIGFYIFNENRGYSGICAKSKEIADMDTSRQKKKLTGYPHLDRPWLKYYSEEARNTSLPECSIYQFFYEKNKSYKNAAAFEYFGKTYTYGEMFRGIQQAEAGFRNAGVQEGDIVSAVAISVPETIYTFYALNKIGAVSNWIDPRKGIEEVKRNICMTGSKICIVQDIFWEQLGSGLLEIPEVTLVLVSLKDSMPVILKWLISLKMAHVPKSKRLIRYPEFIQGKSVRPLEEAAYTKNVPAILEYTGGTTGTPKAVMLSNENVNSIVVQYQICGAPIARFHTYLSVAFPFTAYALICNHHLPLSLGMKCFLCFELDISKVERILIKKRCNHMANTPIMWETIISSKKSQKTDYSFLITPTVGADTISAEGEKRVNEFLEAHGSKYILAKGYGMTEVASGVTFTPTNEVNKLGSVGIPFSHMTIGIFDLDSGEGLSYGEQGEVCIAGPSVMLGYYQDEKATAEVLKYHPDGRLWMHSGDLGHMDEDGFLFIDGRLKRMLINHVGFKIFAPNVEAVISQNAGVEKCCVVGVKDQEHKIGQIAVAYVKATGQQDGLKEQLYKSCRKVLPEYSCPKEIRFINEFPYTSAGKIDFKALEQMAEEDTVMH